jgi:hypothetical protein
VTENDPVDIGVLELVGRDLSGESTRCFSEAVLGRYLGRCLELGLNVQEVKSGRGDNDL